MKMNSKGSLKLAIILLALAGLVISMPAYGKVAIGTPNGWEFSTDGFINAFAIYEDPETEPNAGAGFSLLNNIEDEYFRIRTGLLPCLIAFNVKAPTTNGLDVSARVGFYPQIQNAGQNRTVFASQIDLREAFVNIAGNFGEILAGRALHLYQGKNILTDITLFGVGVQGIKGLSGGTTLGNIGFGYVYTNFGPQIKYTTPDLGGVKIAVSVNDPAPLNSIGFAGAGAGAGVADPTDMPCFEGEVSYAGKFGDVAVSAWLNGIYQEAEMNFATSAHAVGDDVEATGWAAGASVDVMGLHALVSGFMGTGIGSAVLLSHDSLDAVGDEKDTMGVLAHITYCIMGKTTVGIQYGLTDIDQTDYEEGIGLNDLETREAWTVAVHHLLTPSLQVVAEYTKAKEEWTNDADLNNDIYTVGFFFFW